MITERGAALPLREQLLLAQTVYQDGQDPPNWAVVSKNVCAHLAPPPAAAAAWSAEACAERWSQMAATHTALDPIRYDRAAQLALVQRVYAARMDELLGRIEARVQAYRDSTEQDAHDAVPRDAGVAPAQASVPSGAPAPASAGDPMELEEAATAATDGAAAPDNADAAGPAASTTAPRAHERVQVSPVPSSSPPASKARPDDPLDDNDDREVEQDLLGETPAEAAAAADAADVPLCPKSPAARASSERAARPATATYSARRRRSRSRASRGDAVSPSPSPPSSPALALSRSRTSDAHDDESRSPSDAERDKSRRRTTQLLLMLYNQVSNHTHANLFHQAIKEADAPNYYAVIRQPIDLKIIKQRIKEGTIASSTELRCALALMFANSLMYNQPGTEVHRMANEMRLATEALLDAYDPAPRGA